MVSRFERFILDITEIDLYWHRLASGVMKPYGLKGGFAIYFTRLGGKAEGLTSAELAALCGKDKADVSRDLAALEKAGLVTRVRNGESGYRALVMLTESGRALTRQITRKAEQAVSAIGDELEQEEREIFYRVMDQIKDKMQALSQTGLPD